MNFYKKAFFGLFLINISLCHTQNTKDVEFGKPTAQEFALDHYAPEPDAPGVILFETANYYAIPVPKQTAARLVKKVHKKIKVFDAKKFDYATIEIPILSGYYSDEEIKEYRAVTHNGPVQNFVPNSGFYKTQKKGVGNILRFTFPNIQDGSILEYTYTIESPFFYNLDGWDFQHELPTIYSEFITDLPLHYRYKRALYGTQKLKVNKSMMKPDGFRLPSNSGNVETEYSVYAMENVPSFKEESYMLSRQNYISRISYEPTMFISFYGYSRVFARTWEDVDKYFKDDDDFGEQLNNKSYFKRRLPDSILSKTDPLEKAKNIYTFIQNHYSWNDYYYSADARVRDSYDEKVGSVAEINLSLINALKAAKLDAKLMLLSTRPYALPVEAYPVLSNFNYILAVLTINNEVYLLDATDKQAAFGVIPYRALNFHGRVMDFKKGSYWLPIEPYLKNSHYVNAKVNTDENGIFKGKINEVSSGYIALEKRHDIDSERIEDYVKSKQKGKANIEIENYKIENEKQIEKPLKESYNISVEPELVGDKVVLFPFFNDTYISKNPFTLKSRSYPMDFGFPFTNTYLISIDLGDVYEIEHLPESKTVKLPNNDGECTVTYVSDGSKLSIRFNMKLSNYRYFPEAYQSLKEFFGAMVTMLKEEPITLKKR